MIQIRFEIKKSKKTLVEKYITLDFFDEDEEHKEFKKYKTDYIKFLYEIIDYIEKGYEIKTYKLNEK